MNKKYKATWFDYQNQQCQNLYLIATSDEDAERLVLRYLNATHPYHAPHSSSDIDNIIEEGEENYLNENNINEYEIKRRDEHLLWFKNMLSMRSNREKFYFYVTAESDDLKNYMLEHYKDCLIATRIINRHFYDKKIKSASIKKVEISYYNVTDLTNEELIELYSSYKFNKINKFEITNGERNFSEIC